VNFSKNLVEKKNYFNSFATYIAVLAAIQFKNEHKKNHTILSRVLRAALHKWPFL